MYTSPVRMAKSAADRIREHYLRGAPPKIPRPISLSEKEIEHYEKLFRHFDENGNRFLEKNELTNLIKYQSNHALYNVDLSKILLVPIWVMFLQVVESTERPIIGVLAQETSPPINRHFPGYKSYISAAYVKGVESSGARVVPIFIGQDEDYYRSLIKSINGLLLPGGNTWFYSSNGYADAGSVLYEAAKEMNNGGIHFPILGICLGVELLLFLDNNKKEYRTNCYSKNIALPLEFLPNYQCSKLFGSAPGEVLKILREEAVTLNQHRFCITQKNLTEYGLDSRWRALSQNTDQKNDLVFISTIESIDYPFAGLQFHPEKNAYEWRPDLNNPHFPNAIKAARYFFDWIVNESRLNNNKFNNTEEEDLALIYNFQTTFTKRKLIYDELYLIN